MSNGPSPMPLGCPADFTGCPLGSVLGYAEDFCCFPCTGDGDVQCCSAPDAERCPCQKPGKVVMPLEPECYPCGSPRCVPVEQCPAGGGGGGDVGDQLGGGDIGTRWYA
jgi:hypothetical protein